MSEENPQGVIELIIAGDSGLSNTEATRLLGECRVALDARYWHNHIEQQPVVGC